MYLFFYRNFLLQFKLCAWTNREKKFTKLPVDIRSSDTKPFPKAVWNVHCRANSCSLNTINNDSKVLCHYIQFISFYSNVSMFSDHDNNLRLTLSHTVDSRSVIFMSTQNDNIKKFKSIADKNKPITEKRKKKCWRNTRIVCNWILITRINWRWMREKRRAHFTYTIKPNLTIRM